MDIGFFSYNTEYGIRADDLARELEARGFESLWVGEHTHIPASRETPFPGGGDLPKPYYHMSDPFVTLAMAAAVTKKLKLGTGISLVVEHHPISLAKQVATLDHYSDGRFLFGIGGGWNKEEMENHGFPFNRRWKILRERIEAMKAIWTEEKAEYHGEFVDFDPVFAWPKPVQQPGPPVHVGGAFPHGARRAVRYGDGWMPINPGKALGEEIRGFHQMCRDGGREELPVSLFAAPGKPESLAVVRDAGVARAIFMLPPAGREEILPLLDRYAAARDAAG